MNQDVKTFEVQRLERLVTVFCNGHLGALPLQIACPNLAAFSLMFRNEKLRWRSGVMYFDFSPCGLNSNYNWCLDSGWSLNNEYLRNPINIGFCQ